MINQHQDPTRMVSIIIPTYNEARHIEGTIQAIWDAFQGSPWVVEIIVADDGSQDDTVFRVRRLQQERSWPLVIVGHGQNQGKGAALRRGFQHSQGDLVGFVDADGEYPVQALPTMAQIIAEASQPACVIGCRVEDDRTWMERTTSRFAHRLASAVLRLPVSDTQAGLKMFPGPLLRAIVADCRQSGWLYDIELLLRAVEQQLSVIELPIMQRSVRHRRANIWSMVQCGPVLLGLALSHRKRVLRNDRRERRQMLRFGLVGGINSGIDLGVFWLLTQLRPVGHRGIEAGAESLIAWMVASLVGYALHSNYTFERQLSRVGFAVVTGMGLSIQVSLTSIATQWLGHSAAVPGKLTGIALASLVTYVGYRYLAQHRSRVAPLEKTPRVIRAQVPTIVVSQDS